MMSRLAAYDPIADDWRELATPPVESIHSVAFVAAGERLVALGGLEDPDAPMGAWMVDPAGQTWTPPDEPPLSARADAVAVWTGEELLVWSGTAMAVGHEAAAHHDGAAWRPE